jgi:carbonic anhydrase
MSEPLSRRHFLGASGLGVAAALAGPAATSALAAGSEVAGNVSPHRALELLMAGNKRWEKGRVTHPHQSLARREALRHQQHPFATVFSCIDSRAPPELVFDRGIGDLAVVRTGAQALDAGVVLASIEFAAAHLGTALVMVMGHQRCGAVRAAIQAIETGTKAPGHIQAVVDALRPAYRVAKKEHGDLVENMTRAQTRLTVKRIEADPLIKKLIRQGQVKVVGGYYSLDTGGVSLITK